MRLFFFAAALLVCGRAYAVCGDGVVDQGEACDDGNTREGDGCSPTCTVETGAVCATLNALAAGDPGFEGGAPGSGGAWEVLSGNVDWVLGSAFGDCMPAGEDSYSIDLNGSMQGVIGQSFATVVGRKYGVVFLGNANCVTQSGVPCTTTCTRVLTVGVADDTGDHPSDITDPIDTVAFTVNGSPKVTPWQTLRFEFTARTAATLLFFSGSDTALAGPMIDDVEIPTSSCRPSTCGDGSLDGGEACDDGNTIGGDGCTSDCAHIETGYVCATAGQPCAPPCGDGVKQNAEACDDGDTDPGDGCSATCEIESHWQCEVVPPAVASECACSAGYVPDGGACVDACTVGVTCDANATCMNVPPAPPTCACNAGYEGDGATCADVDECAAATPPCDPNAACTNTPGSFTCACKPGFAGDGMACALCGNGAVESPEACDDGNTRAAEGCSATCQIESGWVCDPQTPVAVGDPGFESGAPGDAGSPWKVPFGNINWVASAGDGQCLPAGEGGRSIDLNGDQQGVISQSLDTVAGQKYGVLLLANANCVTASGVACTTTCTRTLTVGAGDDKGAAADVDNLFKVVQYTVSGSPKATPWQTIRFDFTAQSAKTLLAFSGKNEAQLAGPMVDDVQIPASWCRPATCGNGALDAGEKCDDGNTVGGDGCSSDCQQIQTGYICDTPGQPCTCKSGFIKSDTLDLCVEPSDVAAAKGCTAGKAGGGCDASGGPLQARGAAATALVALALLFVIRRRSA